MEALSRAGGGSEPPVPSFSSTYWRSHESRRASGTWVPLRKRKGIESTVGFVEGHLEESEEGDGDGLDHHMHHKRPKFY